MTAERDTWYESGKVQEDEIIRLKQELAFETEMHEETAKRTDALSERVRILTEERNTKEGEDYWFHEAIRAEKELADAITDRDLAYDEIKNHAEDMRRAEARLADANENLTTSFLLGVEKGREGLATEKTWRENGDCPYCGAIEGTNHAKECKLGSVENAYQRECDLREQVQIELAAMTERAEKAESRLAEIARPYKMETLKAIKKGASDAG